MSSRALQWLSLVGIIWLQSINGTNFNFPSYSSQLKLQLSMSQLQLNNLAFASDAGKLFGFVSGFAANRLPLWLVLVIGSSLGLVGYGGQYLFIIDKLCCAPYWVIFSLNVLAGNSICWINTVCYMVVIRNFKANRQVAVGISACYQGLSARIYTNMVELMVSEWSSNAAKKFLLLNSVLPLGVCVLVSPLAKVLDFVENHEGSETGFVTIFVIAILTGVFAAVTSVGSISKRMKPLPSLVGILVFLLLPVVVAVVEIVKDSVKEGTERRVDHFREAKQSGGEEQRIEATMEEIGAKEMVKRINFWLYFGVYFFGGTLGLVFLNNLGQIAESRKSSSVSSLVSLSSSFGFFGRLMPSLLEYCFLRKFMKSKPGFSTSMFMKSKAGWMVALLGAMRGGFFLLLRPNDKSLWISTAIIAGCTGAFTSVSVTMTTELFGADNFGINHNLVVANIPVGSFIYGYFAGLVYKKHADAGTGTCIGVECYRASFLIWGCLCLLGTLLALVLFARTRSFYSTKTRPLMVEGTPLQVLPR